jgi:hypothetical protein
VKEEDAECEVDELAGVTGERILCCRGSVRGNKRRRQDARHLCPHSTQVNSRTS